MSRAKVWTPARITEVVERLEETHGREFDHPVLSPMDELVSCILSQHTADRNSFPTFFALKKKFPKWEAVAKLTQDELAEEIRAAGLANQKAKSILAVLAEIKSRVGKYSIDSLKSMSLNDAKAWLTSLPGVGPKTAAIVLCFSFDMPAIPVDTHIFRVSWRLGLFPFELGADKAHGVLENLIPGDLAFRYHTTVIKHGRAICKAQRPLCDSCPIKGYCDFASEAGAKSAKPSPTRSAKRGQR